MVFDPIGKQLIYPRAVPTGKRADRLPKDAPPGRWCASEKRGYVEYEFQTWAYDAGSNKWTKRKTAGTPDPTYRNRFGLTYDSKNGAVILVGGSSDTWDRREENSNDVWVYGPAKEAWTKTEPKGPRPKVPRREGRHCAYDPESNVVLFLNETLWAYRYKR